MWSPVGIETAAMAAVLGFLSSPSVPRPGGDAGEVVEVFVGRLLPSLLLWPAEVARREVDGRRRSGFGDGAAGGVPLRSLLWPASVARGVGAAGGLVVLVVGLGGASSAGSWVVLGSSCRGRIRSSSSDSVARRRMDVAAFYNVGWRLFPGGRWYGDAGDV